MMRGHARPSRASPRALALLLASLLAAGGFCVQASPAQVGPRRAILARGADPVKGLPFFSPNAIAALAGAYGLGGAAAASPAVPPSASASGGSGAATAAASAAVAVWFTRESLALGPEWKRLELGPYRAYELGSLDGSVVVLRADRYSLFFRAEPAYPPLSEAEARAFMQAFARKFLAFFENAASDAELSFPAFVDY